MATTSSTVPLQTTAVRMAQVTINRQQLAERLYRVTGKGIYQDTVLLNQTAPIQNPLLNANVKGQDSVQTAIYGGQLHWFWGDTLYDVGFGNFRTSGATSQLPGQGGLDPSVGVDLNYYVDASGSSKEMMPLAQPGPVWIDGLFTVNDNSGREQMLTHYSRRDPNNALGAQVEHGLGTLQRFARNLSAYQVYPLDAPIAAAGHAFESTVTATKITLLWRVLSQRSREEKLERCQRSFPVGSVYSFAGRYAVRCRESAARARFSGKACLWLEKEHRSARPRTILEELVQNGHIDRDEVAVSSERF